MKILLIEPPFNRLTGSFKRGYPYNLTCLASYVAKSGYSDIKIYDPDKKKQIYNINILDQRKLFQQYLGLVNDTHFEVWREIEETIESYSPDLVGITTMTSQYASAMRVATIAKKVNERCHVVMGGVHPTIQGDNVVKHPCVDFVVVGEGEKGFLQLLEMLNPAKHQKIKHIPGILFQNEKGEIVETPNSTFAESLDEFPVPDCKYLHSLNSYTPEDFGLMLTSRGCPYKCTFCSNVWLRKVRYLSLDRLLSDIKHFQTNYNVHQFMFKDDSFTVNRKRIMEFCKEVIANKMKFSWETSTRMDLIDLELLKTMRRAGCNRVSVGVESGSERMLKLFNKKLDRKKIITGAKILQESGLFWSAYFMCGLPDETVAEMEKTYKFMLELKPNYAGIGIYKPYPGTEIFELAKASNLVNDRVENDYFFKTNPVDYFFVNTNRRSLVMDSETYNSVTQDIIVKFGKYNSKPGNLWKRVKARQQLYVRDQKQFIRDLRRGMSLFSH